MNFIAKPKEEILEVSCIQEKLHPLIEFYINKTHREYVKKYSAQSRTLFHLLLQVSKNTYKSIIYLCAENPEDQARNPEFILSSIPLLRVLLEIAYSIAFISEDVEKRIFWYCKSGWREMKEKYDRFYDQYSKDSSWGEWFDNYKQYLDKTKIAYNVSKEEENNLKSIVYWPFPSQMKKEINETLAGYFQYLEDWFYKEFSQAVHLSLPGLAKMGSIFINQDEDGKENYFKKNRSDYYISSVVIIMAILSEFENIVDYGKKEELKYLWTFVGEYSNVCKDMYLIRYKIILGN